MEKERTGNYQDVAKYKLEQAIDDFESENIKQEITEKLCSHEYFFQRYWP